MRRICNLCGRKPKRSARRSHSNIRTLGKQRVNIQRVNGRELCTKCLKTERRVTTKRTVAA